MVEVVGRWDELRHMADLQLYERQLLALEALQVGAAVPREVAGRGEYSSRAQAEQMPWVCVQWQFNLHADVLVTLPPKPPACLPRIYL